MIDVLAEARELVAGDRQAAYGTPVEAMRRTAALWEAVDGRPHTGHDVALKLALLKIARESHAHRRDNLIDAAGYLLIADLCAQADEAGQ